MYGYHIALELALDEWIGWVNRLLFVNWLIFVFNIWYILKNPHIVRFTMQLMSWLNVEIVEIAWNICAYSSGWTQTFQNLKSTLLTLMAMLLDTMKANHRHQMDQVGRKSRSGAWLYTFSKSNDLFSPPKSPSHFGSVDRQKKQ